jgi:NTP pyrophosphatase (non-canonical NTP hydrolase)
MFCGLMHVSPKSNSSKSFEYRNEHKIMTLNDQPSETPTADVSLADFQLKIRQMYFDKDIQRGIDGTFMWLMEEIGELATALRQGTQENKEEEFADVIAWLSTIANVAGVDLSYAIQQKYGSGCPGCQRWVCTCPLTEKP